MPEEKFAVLRTEDSSTRGVMGTVSQRKTTTDQYTPAGVVKGASQVIVGFTVAGAVALVAIAMDGSINRENQPMAATDSSAAIGVRNAVAAWPGVAPRWPEGTPLRDHEWPPRPGKSPGWATVPRVAIRGRSTVHFSSPRGGPDGPAVATRWPEGPP